MTSRRSLSVFLVAISLQLTAVVVAQLPTERPPQTADRPPLSANIAGQWDATITNASGIDVPFKLLIESDSPGREIQVGVGTKSRKAVFGERLRAFILNGSERMPFTSATATTNELRLTLEQYDGTITAKLVDGELRGEWSRQTSQGIKHYPFVARRVNASVLSCANMSALSRADWVSPALNGDWEFTFVSSSPNSPDRVAPAHFEQGTARLATSATVAEVEGTIAPVSGDFGLLAGTITVQNGKEPTFRLSRFDGIHILLLTGEFLPDGTVTGKLNNQPFTAVRKLPAGAGATDSPEPSPEAITTMKNPNEVFRFSARDPKTGKVVTQEDAPFKGKPYIVDIFGTWCPNCHDEAPVLQGIYDRYHAQGLQVVALAYEYVDDPARNARLLDIYRKKYGIAFPMLLAGTTDEGQIAKTLPQLQGFGAYPTTIFIGADGKVKKIHAGFAGPATGDRFSEVKKRFEENVQQLIGK